LQLPHDDDKEEQKDDGVVDRETLKIECQLTDVVTERFEERACLTFYFKSSSSSPYLLPPPTTSPPVH
jgi:hypothetical protein